ncbi:formin-like protein 3 [Helicoverpa zea]|uniref:formin-like protein 3 n=1 Tax=Helicoverpa zea TaxID=7113 RepID=UPI001F5A86B7|nr:formin-like protein 3 [Helicoverpa zea]
MPRPSRSSSSSRDTPPPPPPPPRSDSLRLSAEDMVLVANGGARTPSGALAHFLAAYTPAELALARSDYLRPPAASPVPPRSSLSLRVDSAEAVAPRRSRPRHVPHAHSHSGHALRRQGRARSPPSPPTPADLSCDCLPMDPIPPPELFDF